MMGIALGLTACAVFATLTVVAVTAALKSARVDDLIGELFSPWTEPPSEKTGGDNPQNRLQSEPKGRRRPASGRRG